MKKQLLALAVASVLIAPAYAAMPVGTYGAATTLGQTASPVTINSVRFNPAAGYIVVDHKDGESVRFGYWSQIGFGLEFGKADNFQDKVDDLQKKLDALEKTPSSSGVIDVRNTFDTLLVDFGENGNLKFTGATSVPGLPLAFHIGKIDSVITLDAAFSTLVGVSFLDAPLQEPSPGVLFTDSALYVKAASIFQLGAGISKPVFENKGRGLLAGELILGGRANMYMGGLSKAVAKVQRADNKDVGDLISDGMTENTNDTTAFGIDLGAVWHSGNYQIGVTGKNLNSPELKYGTLTSQEARDFYSKGEIALTETYVMDPQFTADAAIYTKNKSLMIAGSMDLNEVNDAVGDRVQNMHLSATYFPSNSFLPTPRVGYQKNLVGTELSALNFGLGLFRGVANLDFTYGLESVQVDGSSVPRQIGMQFSFEESF